MMKRVTRHGDENGVALVATMIVVAVLAVVAVAFMQSMSTDRLSSRTAVNYVQARLVAEAGAAAGEAMVAGLVRRYPDSVTVWQNIGSGGVAGTNNEATVLYARAQSTNTTLGARPGQFGGEVTLLAQPLVSGAALTNLANLAGSMVYAPTDTNMVNLNATNLSRPRPFIGRRSATNAGPPVTAARWIYMGARPGPTNATNPPIARYAFWVEDESFKVNINTVTNGPRPATSLGLAATELRLDGSWASSSNSALRGADFAGVISARKQVADSNFPTAMTAAIAANLTDEQAADELRFLTTAHSAGLDLSRGGFKRFNVNSVGFINITSNALTPLDSSNAAQVRSNLNRVIAAITNSNSVPNIGQRFYRLATNAAGINAAAAVTGEHAQIYLQKIAANLLDYVDQDDQPTIVNNDTDFTIRRGKPEFGIEALGGGLDGTNSVAAMGVENTPRLQEYAIHGRIRQLTPIGYATNAPPPDPQAAYEVSIDHYFEFWNPGTRDITINNAFLKIYDQPRFGTKVTGALASEGRPTSEIPVNEMVFPAGQITVLTTAPPEEINSRLVGANAARVVSLPTPEADRVFSGTTRDVSTNSYAGFNRLFNVSMIPRQTGATDYESGFVLGNNNGILESFVGLPIAMSGGPSAMHFVINDAQAQATVGNINAGNAYFVRGGSLVGNSHITTVSTPSSTEGDPRALNEQLELRIFAEGSIAVREQTRFFLTISNNGMVPGQSSIGGPNTAFAFVRPTNWVDFSSANAGASNAPLVVRNGALQSVGEVGHLTDPARVPGLSGALADVKFSRSGGRTLRVGQPEHPRWYDGNQTNASRTWTSWRLADIFTTTTGSTNGASLDPQGHLTNRLGVWRGRTNTNGVVVTIPGLVNPNGFLRDRGAAWRATLHNLSYLPAPEGVGLPALNTTRINSMLNAMSARLTNAPAAGMPNNSLNAFWERGEISELPFLNTGTVPADMSKTFDRGREELVRRSIELITTRGSIFTVYAIGQTLQGTNVISTARLKQTFQIEPQFQFPADFGNDIFNASQPVRVLRRFSAPTNYTTRVLATSYD